VKFVFSEQAWEDYLHWQKADRQLLERVNRLLREVARSPHEGIGKPEPLRHALAGYWSRRIDDEHRLVYRVQGDMLWIVQVRYHY
jgi:toxin YoeB